MKNRILIYTLAVFSIFGAVGCTDFLTRDPKLQQSTDITLSTYSGLQNATFGAYYYIASNGWYGGSWVINSEMRSGNGKRSSAGDTGRYVQSYTWNYTEDNTSSMWAYCYETVAMANNVIDNLEGKESDEVSTQDLNNLKAECLFIRAFSHFCNVLTYGQPYTLVTTNAQYKDALGVPYVYHTDPNGKPERETVVSNYENIVKDLLEAESIIDPDYVHPGAADAAATVNIYTIQALLSRVYLYMGEWQKAADYATKVIKSGKYTLWDKDQYASVWSADTGSGEVIFEVYGKRTNGAYGGYEDISYITSPEGYGDAQAAEPLVKLYKDGDVRATLFRTDKAGETGVHWTSKYIGKGDNDKPDCSNVIILRLSEMYLNRAEAIMNGATVEGTTAVNDLNAVAVLRGADAYSSVGKKDIKTERRKELAWEGHYVYDLARWGDSVERTETDYPLCAMNLNVEFPGKKWALPIPKREIEVNPNLKQNEL